MYNMRKKLETKRWYEKINTSSKYYEKGMKRIYDSRNHRKLIKYVPRNKIQEI